MADEADEVRLTLRLPVQLRDQIIEKAKGAGRSINAEIVSRLERTIIEEGEFGNIYDFTGELEQRIEKLEARVRDVEEFAFPNRISDRS